MYNFYMKENELGYIEMYIDDVNRLGLSRYIGRNSRIDEVNRVIYIYEADDAFDIFLTKEEAKNIKINLISENEEFIPEKYVRFHPKDISLIER